MIFAYGTSTSKIEKIDETNLWSWEQGARLQWYNDTNLIYNNMNSQKELSTIYNITNHKKIISMNVYH